MNCVSSLKKKEKKKQKPLHLTKFPSLNFWCYWLLLTGWVPGASGVGTVLTAAGGTCWCYLWRWKESLLPAQAPTPHLGGAGPCPAACQSGGTERVTYVSALWHSVFAPAAAALLRCLAVVAVLWAPTCHLLQRPLCPVRLPQHLVAAE